MRKKSGIRLLISPEVVLSPNPPPKPGKPHPAAPAIGQEPPAICPKPIISEYPSFPKFSKLKITCRFEEYVKKHCEKMIDA
jgi:hypothetical protein